MGKELVLWVGVRVAWGRRRLLLLLQDKTAPLTSSDGPPHYLCPLSLRTGLSSVVTGSSPTPPHTHTYTHYSPFHQEWFDLSRDWLVPYAVFSYLRSLFGTADHTK